MTASQHASFGDYVLAGLLLAIILFVTARAFLRAIGLRPPARTRTYIEVPQTVEYVLPAFEDTDERDIEALQEQLFEDEAALLPDSDYTVVAAHLYR